MQHMFVASENRVEMALGRGFLNAQGPTVVSASTGLGGAAVTGLRVAAYHYRPKPAGGHFLVYQLVYSPNRTLLSPGALARCGIGSLPYPQLDAITLPNALW